MSFAENSPNRKLMNLEHSIVREIENTGPISFARFMELALYAPELGYYEQKNRVGRAGDFYTSVSVGNVFGELLAIQFAQWLAEIESALPLQIMECGAHDGQLAHDILEALRRIAPVIFEKINYHILEPSKQRQEWQRKKMADFSNVHWLETWEEIQNISGIIFSNELLDAFPFQRIQWNAVLKGWMEMKVTFDGKQFSWILEPIDKHASELPEIPDALAQVLPDGFQTEISTLATDWWKTAATKIKAGKLLALDYGLTAEEFLLPERSRGTARAYFRHHLVDDLLANVGEQDITSHVNFSALMEAGESAGLETEFFGSQAGFLTGVVEKMLRKENHGWDRKRSAQFQTLTHPTHLGAKFKVIVQRR